MVATEIVVVLMFVRLPLGIGFCKGAVSWDSPRCSAAERYTVFARVGKFRNWIDKNMNSGIIPPTTIPPPQPTTTKAPATPTTASNSGKTQ